MIAAKFPRLRVLEIGGTLGEPSPLCDGPLRDRLEVLIIRSFEAESWRDALLGSGPWARLEVLALGQLADMNAAEEVSALKGVFRTEQRARHWS